MAAEGDVLPGLVEVTGVPGVGYVAMMMGRVGRAGMVEQEADFALGVGGEDAAESTAVFFVHEDEKIVIIVVLRGDLAGSMTGIADAVGFESAEGHGVDGVANLLAAGSG